MDNLPVGTVTFLFTDIQGSTQLWQQHPGAMKAAVEQHHNLLQQAIESNGGYVFQIIGDAFCAAFHTALAGLQAALVSQRLLRDEPWGETGPLRVRMALHAGSAELRPGEFTSGEYATGMTLSHTSRLLSCAHGGQVLVSQAAHDLLRDELPAVLYLRDLGEHRLRDLMLSEHIYQLVVPDLPAEFPALKTEARQSNNLPERRSRFIGRQAELEGVQRCLKEGKLVTLSGSGGIGKTRLALEVARRMLPDYPDGAWLVELAPLTDPELVVQETASVLGVHKFQGNSGVTLLSQLTDALAPKKLLLILDNCEHVIEACARLAERLLDRCDGLRILATSRESLGIEGETILHVPSLSLPAGSKIPLDELASSEAVQLFIDRAGLVKPGYNLNQANAAAIQQICRRLDGIALAIELAASRVKLLQVEQIAVRLDDAFRLLTGGSRTALPRQQTLRATIDWSYNLLSLDERLLLQRLCVFAGGWSLEAAEQVCAGEGIESDTVLDLLSQLENKSLVICDRVTGEKPRFRLLEATRLYAREKLAERGDVDRLRERHLQWCLGFAETFEKQIENNPRASMKHAHTEIDNIRAALEWAFSGSEPGNCRIGAQIAITMKRYWDLSGYTDEHQGWLERGLDRLRDDSDETQFLRGRLLYALGFNLFYWQQERAKGKVVLEEGIVLLRKCMPMGSAILPHGLAVLAHLEADPERAVSMVEESITIGRSSESEDQSSLARALYWRAGFYHSRRNDFSTAYASAEESLRLARRHGYIAIAGVALKVKGDIALHQGDFNAAQAYYEESLPMLREGEDIPAASGVTGLLAGIDLINGEFAAARRRFEERSQFDRDRGYEFGYYLSRTYAGITTIFQGDYAAAGSLLRECLPHIRKSIDDAAVSLAGLAYLAILQAARLRAGRLLGAAAAIVASMGELFKTGITAYTRISYYRLLEMCQDGYDQAAWEEGYKMTIDQAIDYAIESE